MRFCKRREAAGHSGQKADMGSVIPFREAPQRQTPLRRPNAELRTREHLTEREVEKLIEAAKANRHGHRDATMILIAYRHGLRASELCRPAVESGAPQQRRPARPQKQNGSPATHPLTGRNYAPCAA